MKTTKNKANVKEAVKGFLKNILAFVLLFIVGDASMNAQIDYARIKPGICIDGYISGNLLGTLYSPCITLAKGNGTIFGGAVIQQRTTKSGGFRFGYSYNITGGNEKSTDYTGELVDGIISLNAFGYVQYTNGFSLSYRSQMIEERGSSIKDYDWSTYQTSTAEFCGGVELNIRISKNLKWKNYAGFTVCEQKNYMKGMWNDKNTVGLVLGTGICIQTSR